MVGYYTYMISGLFPVANYLTSLVYCGKNFLNGLTKLQMAFTIIKCITIMTGDVHLVHSLSSTGVGM